MGHVGTAMKLNSESIWFNPAAASFQEHPDSTSRSASPASTSKATYTIAPRLYGQDQVRGTTPRTTSIATPLYAYFNYKPLDWMSVGLAFNTPFGSSMDWGNNWAGGATRPVDQPQGLQYPAYRLVQTLRTPLHRRRSDDDLGQVRPFALAAAYRRRRMPQNKVAHGRHHANASTPQTARPSSKWPGTKT